MAQSQVPALFGSPELQQSLAQMQQLISGNAGFRPTQQVQNWLKQQALQQAGLGEQIGWVNQYANPNVPAPTMNMLNDQLNFANQMMNATGNWDMAKQYMPSAPTQGGTPSYNQMDFARRWAAVQGAHAPETINEEAIQALLAGNTPVAQEIQRQYMMDRAQRTSDPNFNLFGSAINAAPNPASTADKFLNDMLWDLQRKQDFNVTMTDPITGQTVVRPEVLQSMIGMSGQSLEQAGIAPTLDALLSRLATGTLQKAYPSDSTTTSRQTSSPALADVGVNRDIPVQRHKDRRPAHSHQSFLNAVNQDPTLTPDQKKELATWANNVRWQYQN